MMITSWSVATLRCVAGAMPAGTYVAARPTGVFQIEVPANGHTSKLRAADRAGPGLRALGGAVVVGLVPCDAELDGAGVGVPMVGVPVVGVPVVGAPVVGVFGDGSAALGPDRA
ncbi:MAG TPA: hypothetical protein VIO13_06325 [Candidatus Dormibacteraeota bacterium]